MVDENKVKLEREAQVDKEEDQNVEDSSGVCGRKGEEGEGHEAGCLVWLIVI